MPEIRRNSISDQIVLVAPERRQRPNEFAAARTASDLTRSDSTRSDSTRSDSTHCPFCPGNEDAPPPAVEELHAADSPNQWLVRVVPNLYPAVFDLDQGEPPVVEGRTPALGKHEVVIECRRHVRQFTELSHQESELAFLAYQRRFQAWKQNPQLRFGIALKNSGEQAGASMEHVHSQLIGLTEIPPIAQTELDSALRHYESRGSCVFCDLLADENRQPLRIVDQNDHFTALCPRASRFAYEIWILPHGHVSHFEDDAPETIAEAARFLRHNLRRLQGLTPSPAYNYLIHSAPFDTNPNDHYHWHIEVLPRLGHLAGFELGTGYSINAVAPEQAALELRDVSLGKV